MNEIRYRFASGVLTGCLVLLGACAVDTGPQSSEQTSTTESEVLVQSCPPTDACENWSSWTETGSQFCTDSGGACGEYCADPVPGATPECDFQIIPTSDCCNLVLSNPETDITLQRFRWCDDFNGNRCEEIEQTSSFSACGC